MKNIVLNMNYDLSTIEYVKCKFVNENLKGHVLAIIMSGDDILLIRRLKSSTKNDLCLPGGNIRCEETFMSGVKREIREELNINIRQPKLIGNIKNRFLLNGKCLWESKGKIFFVTKYTGSVVIEHKELKSFSWYNKNKLPRLKFNNSEILKYLFSNETKDLYLDYSIPSKQ